MKRNSEDATMIKNSAFGKPSARGSVPWLVAFAFAGLLATGCTVTLDNGSDAGDGSAQDSGGSNTDDSSSSGDGGTMTTDSGGSVDGSMASMDATTADGSTSDGGLAESSTDAGSACVAALYGSYVVRGDGKLLAETVTGLSGSETVVLNAGSGVPLGPVQNVQDGNSHGCAAVAGSGDASTSGSAWCWRTIANGNASGQLGSGTADTTGPVFHATQVMTAANQPLANVVSVADGPANTACAVRQDGKLYCWGDVTWALNGGAALSSPYALPVTTDGMTPLTNVLQAAVHSTFACAIVKGSAANEVWCWGFNNGTIANLGVGDSVNHQYPTKVVGPINPTAVRIADFNGAYGTTCVVDGANVRCWGGSQALGNVSSNGVNPALVELQDGTTPLGNVVDLKRGLQSFCTLNSDSTAWCWGAYYKGYASKYAALNVTLLGEAGGLGGSGAGGPRFVTSDAVYHIGSGTRMLSCGPL